MKDGRIKIVPRRFARVYLNWMENIRDWCISRQLWWGHRIPVWYCDDCDELTLPSLENALEDPQRCQHCGSAKIRQDPDVLDTWFSSGLWPHSTLGWPDDTEDLRYFYPTSVMETGYDILFFWVARMIMMGLYNTGEVPFRTVYLHGLIRDHDGRKMSKSLGNVVDPLEVLERYGTDALRFALATGGAPGNDMRISDERLEGGRNFANKLWNAARFVISSLGDAAVEPPSLAQRQAMPLEDRWIMSRLHRTAAEVEKLLGDFQVGEAGRRLHDFFWGEFCDWYIEMAKVRLKAGDAVAAARPGPRPGRQPAPPPPLHALRHRGAVAEPAASPSFPRGRGAHRRPLAPGGEGVVRRRGGGSGRPACWTSSGPSAMSAPSGAWSRPASSRPMWWSLRRRRDAAEASRPVIEALARARPLHIVDGAGAAPREDVVAVVLQGAEVILPLAGMLDIDAERARLRGQATADRGGGAAPHGQAGQRAVPLAGAAGGGGQGRREARRRPRSPGGPAGPPAGAGLVVSQHWTGLYSYSIME